MKVKIGTDTAKSTDMMIAGFRQCRDLIGSEYERCSLNMSHGCEQIDKCLFKSKSCESLSEET